MNSLGFALLAIVAGATIAGPADLLTPDLPNGYELASEPAVDLTFDEFAALSPEAVEHVDPSGAEAGLMRAAVDVWTLGEDDVLTREVTVWSTEDAAGDYVEQAIVVGTLNERDATDAPFDGAVAFIGANRGLWTRTITWRQGPYAMTVSHFTVTEGNDGIINRTARALADRVRDATGDEVDPSVVAAPVEPDGGSDGVTIGTLLIWSALIGGGVWMGLQLMNRRRGMSTRLVNDPIEH